MQNNYQSKKSVKKSKEEMMEEYCSELFKGVDIESLITDAAFMDQEAWDKIRIENSRLPKEMGVTKLAKEQMSTFQRLMCWDELELYRRTRFLGPKKPGPDKKRPMTEEKRKRKRGGKRIKLAKQVAGLKALRTAGMGDEYIEKLLEVQSREVNFCKKKKKELK